LSSMVNIDRYRNDSLESEGAETDEVELDSLLVGGVL
jgi:hypothetical protein